MATKDPKRVAAGKKAWRNRAKGGARRAYARGKSYRRKPIQRGIGGKIGAFLLGVAPTGISGLEAASATMSVAKVQDLSALSAVHFGFLRFVNNMSVGFLGTYAFGEQSSFYRKNGQAVKHYPGAGVPKGSLLITSGVGLFLMLEDFVASKLAGGRPVKILGTNYNAIGGS